MKGLAKIVFFAALWLPLAGFAGDSVPDAPQDYAWGMRLNNEGKSPFWQVPLPTQIYEQTVWPDLRDVRVFNIKGEAAPYALIPQQHKQNTPQPVALKAFPLGMTHAKQDGQNTLKVKMPGGAEIHLSGDEVDRITQSFLLALPDGQKTPLSVSQVRLDWQKQPTNWQAKASLFYSEDLKNWQTLTEDAPLMDLTAGNDQLTLNTLRAGVTLSQEEGPRYLLMTLSDTAQPLDLKRVQALPPADFMGDIFVYLPGRINSATASEAVYSWRNPQPLSALAINPANEDQVLPVEIDYRSQRDAPWRPLAKTVLYRVSDAQSAPLPLNGDIVQAIRVRGINARWGDTPPEVQGLRASQTLVFISQGAGPYMLAWGNNAAKPQAMALEMIIPERLRGQYTLDSLPVATEADTLTLGGEARLTAVDPAERRSQWMTAVIWGVLILGVLALLWVALRLWREVKNKS